jgi:methylthioxylose transferase
VVGLAWLLALAFMDGTDGISRVLGNDDEYLRTAREVTEVPVLLAGFVDRIPASHPDNWDTHVAGHPPGALLFFVALVRVGLGGDFAAGMVVTVVAASTAPAVLITVRALGAEVAARRAAPFVVLGPSALFMAVSADAVFTVVAAWGLAALALAATAERKGRATSWSVLAGVLLGGCLLLSYGLPLLALLALAVLAAARSWQPLPVVVVSALAVVLAFAVGGFAWWEAYPVLTDRYWDGLAADRPATYWLWANLAALALSAGPLLGAGLASLVTTRRRVDRVVILLVTAAAAAVVVADLSRMSKAEVERIWLPFVPWLLLSTALLPEPWRRWGLALQLATAMVVETLLYTTW